MSRRRKGRGLREITKPEGREERLEIKRWLASPKSFATREEVYMLVREYEYGVQRNRWKRTFPTNIVWALWLVLSAPIRIPLRLWRKRKEEPADEV